MYDAKLDRCFRKDACNRIGKALETVHAGDEDILDSSVLEIRKDTEPKVGSLAPGYVHAQKLFPSLACKGQYIIDGSCHWTVLLVHYLNNAQWDTPGPEAGFSSFVFPEGHGPLCCLWSLPICGYRTAPQGCRLFLLCCCLWRTGL